MEKERGKDNLSMFHTPHGARAGQQMLPNLTQSLRGEYSRILPPNPAYLFLLIEESIGPQIR